MGFVFSFSWPHEKRPGPRSSQMEFVLQSMLVTQYLFKRLCLIHCLVPLLTDLLSCIFTIEEWECDPHSY